MNILGISAGFHDASATVLDRGDSPSGAVVQAVLRTAYLSAIVSNRAHQTFVEHIPGKHRAVCQRLDGPGLFVHDAE